ncbi:2-amino-4-hydroxy-6-hydroxymethyldihydropteridine diphosphokinase [Lentisphaerota bacterium WC36G]|nr:2-amino-4-hydroxy-6-hydroxymethyldihydropteridine diphosphokinase [Lentisphaerae bacterium WC36]
MEKIDKNNNINIINVALGVGGNLNDVRSTIKKACDLLVQNGFENLKISNLIETEPVGCPEGIPNFLNGAIVGIWKKSLDELFELCKNIEEKLGRPRIHERWVSRTIDLDILIFGEKSYDIMTAKGDQIVVPHCELFNRLFVLEPLSEIAGNWKIPHSNYTVKEYLAELKK